MISKNQKLEASWSDNQKPKKYPGLKESIEVDIAIVGGGITGITAGYLMAKAGKKVAILEMMQVGKGTTGSSTGNLYGTVDEHLYSIESKHGKETVRDVISSRLSAINFMEELVKKHKIDCGFERVPFHLFTTPETKSRSGDIDQEFVAVSGSEMTAERRKPADFPYEVDRILSFADQAQLNPLRYVRQLADAIPEENCRIYEGTQVTGVEDGLPCTVRTTGGTVKAKKVIMATHTPKGIYAVHTAMQPYREYAVAAKLKQPLPPAGSYWHLREAQHYSIRPVREGGDQYLLALGEAHTVGHKKTNEENFDKIEKYLEKNFDVDRVIYRWAAQNYKAADHLPYIGTSPLQRNVYIATGFAADGLVYGTLAAMIIHDLILDKENPLAELYNPTRFTPAASAKKLIEENLHVGAHLMKDYLAYGEADELKEIAPGEGKTLKLRDEKLAAYRSEGGELHVVSGICPHMGCAVHWNNAEKSWDCPCHGSRFSVEGEVLEGPAYTGLTKPGNPPIKTDSDA